MEVTLSRADLDNAKELHAMQIEAFKGSLEKYQDLDTSPANENIEKVGAHHTMGTRVVERSKMDIPLDSHQLTIGNYLRSCIA